MLFDHRQLVKDLLRKSTTTHISHHGLITPLTAQLSCCCLCPQLVRSASSSSSRWLARQNRDPYTRATKVNALKSRAAFKLLEIDQKHRLFRPGQTVVDLGYAPGSWSQVAVSRVRAAGGRVIGIDAIPAQPPRGVSTIQGDFLSAETRQRVMEYVRDPSLGLAPNRQSFASRSEEAEDDEEEAVDEDAGAGAFNPCDEHAEDTLQQQDAKRQSKAEIAARDEAEGRVVDVVLSDMMMNTTGNSFKDHVGSMDLCLAALSFSYDTLRTGGSLLCKYYQGNEDKKFELQLKALFEKVYRIKPDSSRKESREGYFLAARRRFDVSHEQVFGDKC